MTDRCHSCGEEYETIGIHWRRSECPWQPLTERQHEVLTGLLMGDSYVSSNGKNPYFKLSMTSEKYKWPDDYTHQNNAKAVN